MTILSVCYTENTELAFSSLACCYRKRCKLGLNYPHFSYVHFVVYFGKGWGC